MTEQEYAYTPHEQPRKKLSRGKKTFLGCGGCLGIVILIGIIGGVLTALGIIDEPETVDVEIPDVVGLPGDEARDQIRDANLDPSSESEDGAVFNPANWEVESTDPEAGATLEEGEEVVLHMVRPAGEEDEPEQVDEDDAVAPEEEEEDASAADEEVESSEEEEDRPEDEEFYDINQSEFQDESGETVNQILVEFEIRDNFTRNLIISGAENDTIDGILAAVEEYPDYDRISINAYGPTVDEYGNEDMSLLVIAAYDRATVEEINFDNRHMLDIWDLRDAGGGCMPALCAD